MIKPSRKTKPAYVFVDLCFMAISFFIPYILNAIRKHSLNAVLARTCFPNFTEYCFAFTLWGIFIAIAFKGNRLYTTDRMLTVLKELLKVFKCIFFTGVIIGSVIFLTKYKFFSRFVFGGSCILLFVTLGGWRTIKRLILAKLIKDGFRNINILIIGAGQLGKLVLEEIQKQAHLGFRVVGFIDEYKSKSVSAVPILSKLSNFTEIVQKYFIDEVIIALPSDKETVSRLIKQAEKMRLGIRIVPEQLEDPLPILSISHIGLIPLITYKTNQPHPSETTQKRFFDIVISLTVLLLLLPIFAIIAILIKINSAGPVFFIQRRFGYKGRVFNLYKFRSMVKDASKQKEKLLDKNEVKDGVIFKIRKDPRITGVGKFLRKWSLDELPQLWNVLKNDMSVVGPRPWPIDQIKNNDLKQLKRLEIKPGITGLPQIKGRSDLSFSRWVRWDLWYINHWSFGLDMRILLWTIPAIIKGKGAY